MRVEYRRSTTATEKALGDLGGAAGVVELQPLEWHLCEGDVSVMEVMGPKGVPMVSLQSGSRGMSLAQCGLVHSWLGSHVHVSGVCTP